jgi:hypothetical protein
MIPATQKIPDIAKNPHPINIFAVFENLRKKAKYEIKNTREKKTNPPTRADITSGKKIEPPDDEVDGTTGYSLLSNGRGGGI